MQPYHSKRYFYTHGGPAVASPVHEGRKRSSSARERSSSLPRISVIQDEVDISGDDSSTDCEGDQELSDYESEGGVSTSPSVQRPPTPQTDWSDAWSSRYSTPALENQRPQILPPFQRRISIAGGQPSAPMSMSASQSNDEGFRRFSVPAIEIKRTTSDQGPSTQKTPPPKLLNPPLKLYPWMTRKESPPKRETRIKCPYPTNDCTDSLPKNMVVWRRHLADKHGLAKDDALQTCEWPGCGRTMGGRSLNRHVVITHMDFKTSCPYCKERRRLDHLEKHVANCSENPARVV